MTPGVDIRPFHGEHLLLAGPYGRRADEISDILNELWQVKAPWNELGLSTKSGFYLHVKPDGKMVVTVQVPWDGFNQNFIARALPTGMGRIPARPHALVLATQDERSHRISAHIFSRCVLSAPPAFAPGARQQRTAALSWEVGEYERVGAGG